MAQLIIFRHGESLWNLENRFTGWTDVGLTPKGIAEAKEAGEKLKHFKLDIGYVSELIRTEHTLAIALKVCGQQHIPVIVAEALNERNYGDLQGLNKAEAAKKFGEEQVMKWRRSYDVAPPNGESLKDTMNRAVAYFQKTIIPVLRENKTVVMATHGNTMRALIMHLENISPEEISKLEFKTGEMLLYEFDGNMNITKKQTI